jgi:hypothetical protein
MTLLLIGSIGALYLFYKGLSFYRSMDWDEPPESSPDFGAMRKKQAELLHVQDVLTQAHEAGKISQALLAEFNCYVESEVEAMKTLQLDWEKKRHARRKEIAS